MNKKISSYFNSTKKFIRRHWKLLGVVAILGLIGLWQLQTRGSEEEQLVFQQPERRELVKTLEISGVVDAKERAQMRFLTGGKITYLGAKEGDWVERHQTIAWVDARSLQKQQDKDLNNYLIERWNWENTQDAIDDESLDDTERRTVEQEQFRLNNSVLDVEIRQIAIQESGLYAPFAGILTLSPASVAGVQLGPTDYFELVNPNTLIFRAAVDEADIANVAIGQQAEIELDAYPGENINSEVSFVAFTSSQSSTGTVFLIELPIPNPDINTFRLGMSGDVSILLDTEPNAMTIPLIATREREGKVFVDVKTGENEFEEREIELGLETDDAVEVVSGLSEEDWILIPN